MMFSFCSHALIVSVTTYGGLNFVPGIDTIDQPIASINITAAVAYEITLADDTNGALLNGINTVPYRVRYDNGPLITLTTTPLVVESSVLSVLSGERFLTITVDGNSTIGIPAGDYSTTLTVEIMSL